MARLFDGINDYLVSAAKLSALNGLTNVVVGAWIDTDWLADDDVLFELSPNSNTNNGTFRAIGSASGLSKPIFTVNGSDGAGNSSMVAVSNPASGYHHFAVKYNLANDGGGGLYEVEKYWLDGVSIAMTNDASPNNTGTFTDQFFYVMSRGGAGLFADGRLSDLAIWEGSSFDTAQAALLASGKRAGTVLSSDLLHYWPLEGLVSPEPAFVGGVSLNVFGAVVADDPATLESLTPPLSFTVTRIDNDSASIAWDPTDATITDGVTICRAPGDKTATLDGAGVSPGADGYDPTTISGASVIATNVITSPYVDNTPAARDYTWWLNRADPA